MMKIRTEKNKKILRMAAVLIALLFWQSAAGILNQSLLIPYPAEVLTRFWEILKNGDFLASAIYSTGRIFAGFITGLFIGILLAGMAAKYEGFEIFLNPYMITVKSVPVASFIIIALIWLSSGRLVSFIAFLIVLPIIYTNVLEGLRATDRKKLEMCKIFGLGKIKKIVYVYIPGIRSHIYSAIGISAGMAWKAGIAAEVIGIPKGSMGKKLYEAKVYLDTPSLLAWTLGIVLLSLLFEKALRSLCGFFYYALEKL